MLLFLQCDLWSIIGDSGFAVSSLVTSESAFFSFHLLTGKMGTRPASLQTAMGQLHETRFEQTLAEFRKSLVALGPILEGFRRPFVLQAVAIDGSSRHEGEQDDGAPRPASHRSPV